MMHLYCHIDVLKTLALDSFTFFVVVVVLHASADINQNI